MNKKVRTAAKGTKDVFAFTGLLVNHFTGSLVKQQTVKVPVFKNG